VIATSTFLDRRWRYLNGRIQRQAGCEVFVKAIKLLIATMTKNALTLPVRWNDMLFAA